MDIVEFEMFDYCKSFKQFLFYAVDELPIIEKELKRSLCRKQASEVCFICLVTEEFKRFVFRDQEFKHLYL
jgi:hypothetical protein